MKTILVSLVSEQTIPNVIVADYFRPDIYWFISTKKMEAEDRIKYIEYALNFKGHDLTEENVRKEIVDPNSLTNCIEKIEKMADSVGEDINYIINITGGNKIMALGAFEVFTNVGEKVSIGYMPLGKNEFIQIYPRKKPFKVVQLPVRLKLKEYLASYGFTIQNEKKLLKAIELAKKRQEISKWILNNYEKLKGLLGFMYQFLGRKRKEKKFTLSEKFNRRLSAIELEFLSKFGFRYNGSTISKDIKKDEICFITGGWLEEYVFVSLNELVNKEILDDALLGVQLKSIHGADSELDTAFMKNNAFYHIECKTLGDKNGQNLVRDEIYKKGAISTLLGKGSKRAIICTTFTEIKESVHNRAQDYDIEVLNINEVRNLNEQLTKKILIN